MAQSHLVVVSKIPLLVMVVVVATTLAASTVLASTTVLALLLVLAASTLLILELVLGFAAQERASECADDLFTNVSTRTYQVA